MQTNYLLFCDSKPKYEITDNLVQMASQIYRFVLCTENETEGRERCWTVPHRQQRSTVPEPVQQLLDAGGLPAWSIIVPFIFNFGNLRHSPRKWRRHEHSRADGPLLSEAAFR